jgi:cell division protein FtsN
MKNFAAALVAFALLLFACKEDDSAAQTPSPAPAKAEAAKDSELPLQEQIDSIEAVEAKIEEETKSAEPRRLSAPVPPTSSVSAPLAALAKPLPKSAKIAPKVAYDPNTWDEAEKPKEAKPKEVAEKPKETEKPKEEEKPKEKEKPKVAAEQPHDAGQLNSGKYTIQIGVFPNEIAAKKGIAQLAEKGINAYYTKIYNPAKLLGSHYRVRIGYFSERAYAETYAKAKLEPIGYAWWVDVSKNDKVETISE